MAEIFFSRNHSYINKYREIHIFDEDRFLTKIKSGEELKLEVPSGKKTIYAKVDWAKSNKLRFEINRGDKKHILIKSKKSKYPITKGIFSLILAFLAPYIFDYSKPLIVIYMILSSLVFIDLIKAIRLLIMGKDLIKIEFREY